MKRGGVLHGRGEAGGRCTARHRSGGRESRRGMAGRTTGLAAFSSAVLSPSATLTALNQQGRTPGRPAGRVIQ